ncbi:hypothetical protein [Sphingomonas jatrophae]|uniref:Uncharacterized protein n=1 Tax=Sphingomonas jatrophae TaxID=1166337 RepID=A0A1I6LEE4_9SPHN|nr:hypothetical protein [Sphingomonas jatrophae]SFS01640.1 hypothetical protein SAMN05192580_2623 [Sphingomonas jatrophae]
MTNASLIFMALVGAAALALGIGLLIAAGQRRHEESRYVSRLAGVMVCALGLVLIVFAGSWVFWS